MKTTTVSRNSLAAPPPAAGSGQTRLAGLDGLRAVAVVLVMVYHFFPRVVPGGFVGVDVFFVISGFLITGLLVTEHARTGRVSLRRFWQRRVRRLVPPLIPVILLSCTAAWLIGGDVLIGLGRQLLGAVTFGYNWVSMAGDGSYFSTDQPELFRNLWSLGVEEQFYLLWPLALLALLLVRARWVRLGLVVLLAAGSLVWMGALFQPGADPTRVYYGSDTHSFGLFIGAALALLLRRPSGRRDELPRARPWIGAAALLGIVASAFLLPEGATITYRGGLVLVSLLTAVAIWAGVRGGRFGRMLDAAPLRYLGQRSYGLYLWHWPVLVLLKAAWPSMPGSQSLLPVGLLATGLTLALAAASYRWLEGPVRHWGLRAGIQRLVGRPRSGPPAHRRVVVLAAATTMLLVAGTTASVLAAPGAATAQVEISRGQDALDAAAEAAEAARAAVPAPLPGGDLISAVGDSVMLASAPELQAAFPGVTIDAAVSRGMHSAAGILAELAASGQLRPIVVVGLGTNGPTSRTELDAVLAAIGPHRQLILVNAFADRDWTPGVNSALADFAARHRLVDVANWSDAIAGHTELLAEDHIHPRAAGGQMYADSISAALQRLAELPPERVPGANRLLPDPV